MNNSDSPFRAHKGGRDKSILLRATQAEVDKLNAVCKARKERHGARGSSQADVLFSGMETANFGKAVYKYRQLLSDMVEQAEFERNQIDLRIRREERFNLDNLEIRLLNQSATEAGAKLYAFRKSLTMIDDILSEYSK